MSVSQITTFEDFMAMQKHDKEEGKFYIEDSREFSRKYGNAFALLMQKFYIIWRQNPLFSSERVLFSIGVIANGHGQYNKLNYERSVYPLPEPEIAPTIKKELTQFFVKVFEVPQSFIRKKN